MSISIRKFTASDLDFALAQTGREGWDATSELFETCLAYDPAGCFIAESERQRVGMVTTTRYRRSAWIGNLITVPAYRRRGIGERLAKHAMAHLASQGIQTIRLEADPPGIRIYRRLGFVDEFESLRLWRRAGAAPERGLAERIRQADLSAVAAFDAERFGDDRNRLLQLLFCQALATYLLRGDGRVRGYAFVSPSRFGLRIGPWIATDGEAAEALLRAMLADWPDTLIGLGVPGANVEVAPLLESCGFARTASSFRMVYGDKAAAGHPEKTFAIANGAMG